jgi:hypothetical protein
VKSRVSPNCRDASKGHLGGAPERHWKVLRSIMDRVVRPKAADAQRLAELSGLAVTLSCLGARSAHVRLNVTAGTPSRNIIHRRDLTKG